MDEKPKSQYTNPLQTVPSNLDQFLEAKKAIRRDLIALPFEEKIRRIIEMQKMEKELKKDKSRKIYVWDF